MESALDTRRREIVAGLLASYRESAATIRVDSGKQVNRDIIRKTLDSLRSLIFPGYFGEKRMTGGFVEYQAGCLVEDISYALRKQVSRALLHRVKNIPIDETAAWIEAEEITYAFLIALPRVRSLLAMDVDALFDGDPAAFNRDEIITSYPGLCAIMTYRLAHELFTLDVPLIPRMMTEQAHTATGIDIHPGAVIGDHFFIDHGTGVVIGGTSIIGNHVKIYQGVTIGALSTRGGQSLNSVKRHPTIKDNVTIYSGASILGGETVIGSNVIVGGNAFITSSVPDNTKVSITPPQLQFKSGDKTEFTALEQDFWDYQI